MMNAERWQEVERLYHAAMEHTEEQRGAFVEHACAGDERLRAEVEGLLKYAGRPAPILDSPALEVVAQALAESLSGGISAPVDKMLGARIAQYRIVGKLGVGGMGDVGRL